MFRFNNAKNKRQLYILLMRGSANLVDTLAVIASASERKVVTFSGEGVRDFRVQGGGALIAFEILVKGQHIRPH